MRVDLALNSWSPATTQSLIGKFGASGNRSPPARAPHLRLLRFSWSATDGIATLNGESTVVLPTSLVNGQRLALRVTVDVDNGASGRTIRFYTAPTLAGPWTQLGGDRVQAGVTALFSGGGALGVGAQNAGGINEFSAGKVYGFEVRNGIDGTPVTTVDFGDKTPGTRIFTDWSGRPIRSAAPPRSSRPTLPPTSSRPALPSASSNQRNANAIRTRQPVHCGRNRSPGDAQPLRHRREVAGHP